MKRPTLKVDEILKHILEKDLTETRDLIRFASGLVGELVDKKEIKVDGQNESGW